MEQRALETVLFAWKDGEGDLVGTKPRQSTDSYIDGVEGKVRRQIQGFFPYLPKASLQRVWGAPQNLLWGSPSFQMSKSCLQPISGFKIKNQKWVLIMIFTLFYLEPSDANDKCHRLPGSNAILGMRSPPSSLPHAHLQWVKLPLIV